MINKYICILFLFLISCSNNININDLLKTNNYVTNFELNNICDTILETNKGTLVYLDFTKTDYQGEVNIEIIEAYDTYSQIANNLSTISDKGILETKGMIKVNVLDTNQNQILKSVYCKIPKEYDSEYQTYKLKDEYWNLSSTNCGEDIQIKSYYIISYVQDEIQYRESNKIIFEFDTIRLGDFINNNINACDLNLNEENIGQNFVINFIKDSVTNNFIYDRVIIIDYNLKDSLTITETNIDLKEIFIDKEIIPLKFADSTYISFLETNANNYAQQPFIVTYTDEILNDLDKLEKKLKKSGNKLSFLKNSFFKTFTGGWYNIDKLSIPNNELVVKFDINTGNTDDLVYAKFKKENILISLSKNEKGKLFSKLPLNREFNVIVVGVRNSKLCCEVKNNISLKNKEEVLKINSLKEVSLDELKKILNKGGEVTPSSRTKN